MNTLLTDAISSVKSVNNPLVLISAYRKKLSENQIYKFAAILAKTPLKVNLSSLFFPKKIQTVQSRPFLSKVDIRKSILWQSSIFTTYHATIKKFLEIKTEIELTVQEGKYKDALFLVQQIEDLFGYSFWSTSIKFALVSDENGLEAQKELKEHLYSQGLSDIFQFLVYHWSMRAENKVSSIRFLNNTTEMLEDTELDSGFNSYLHYQLIGPLGGNNDIKSAMHCATTTSIIDQYELFVDAGIQACIDDATSELWSQEASRLFAIIGDKRLGKIALTHTSFDLTKLNHLIPSFEIRDSITLGKEETVSEATPKNLEELYSKSSYFHTLNESDKFARTISSLHTPSSKGEESALKALKIALMYSKLDTGKWLNTICWNRISINPQSKAIINHNRFFYSDSLEASGLFSNDKEITTALTYLYDSQLEDNYYITWEMIYHNFDINTESQLKLELKLPSIRRSLLDAWKAFNKERHAEFIEQANSILSSNFLTENTEVKKKLILSYIFCNDLTNALEALVKLFFESSEYGRDLPLNEIKSYIEENIEGPDYQDINLPLFYYLYENHHGPTLSNYTAYAFEDFLEAHSLKRPSDMRKARNQFENKKLVFFLRKICSQEYMQYSQLFKSSKQLDDERISVCNILMEIDPENIEEYQTELKELVRRNHIQSAVKQLQKSKISIDETEIRKWASNNIKEDFLRLKDLLTSGQHIAGKSYIQSLYDALNENKIDLSLFSIPKNEAGHLLQEVARRYVREAYLNQEHGLDCYLSMRIRHGTLSGQLRKPLEDEHLITKRSVDNSEYLDNTFWKEGLSYRLSLPDLERVISRLNIFSKDIDDLIQEITDENIHIKRDDKKNGLFIPRMQTPILMYIASRLEEDCSFDEFLDSCSELFWASVSMDLSDVKTMLKGKLKSMFTSIIHNLETDIGHLSQDEWVSSLKDASRRASTALYSSIDRVTEWFELPNTGTSVPFELDELIEIGLESVRAIHSDFHPTVTKDTISSQHIYGDLNTFSDIFFIIFENIHKHSGYIENQEVHISTRISGKNLLILIKNPINLSDTVKQSKQNNINSIKENLGRSEYREALRTEGGTGLYKLRKLLGSSNSSENPLDFGIEGNNFYISMKLQSTNYLKKR